MTVQQIARALLQYSTNPSAGIGALVRENPQLDSDQLAEGLILMRLIVFVGGAA